MQQIKQYIQLALFGSLIAITSCTTAVIDEGSVDSLPPLNRTVTYNSDVQNIMFNSCVTCHGGAVPQAGLDLTTYQNVKTSTEFGTLIQRMNNAVSPMPPSGLLSPQTRQIMDKWVQDGFPEN